MQNIIRKPVLNERVMKPPHVDKPELGETNEISNRAASNLTLNLVVSDDGLQEGKNLGEMKSLVKNFMHLKQRSRI